ncbi:hypothetical protein Tco_0534422 [Tanacetum coccineum]
MPRIHIPLFDHFGGCYRFGIKCQDSEHLCYTTSDLRMISTWRYQSSIWVPVFEVPHHQIIAWLEEPEQAPPSLPGYYRCPTLRRPKREDAREVEGGSRPDYPADRGDDDDDALALAEPAAIAYSADQDPYIAYRVVARMSIRTQAPPTYVEGSLGSELRGIDQEMLYVMRLRDTRDVVTASGEVTGWIVIGPPQSTALLDRRGGQKSSCRLARSMMPVDQVHLRDVTADLPVSCSSSLRSLSTGRRPEETVQSLTAQMTELQRQQGPAKGPAERVPRRPGEQFLDGFVMAMDDEGVTAVLDARATTRKCDDSQTSGNCARRTERSVGSAPIKTFMNVNPYSSRVDRRRADVVSLHRWLERMET